MEGEDEVGRLVSDAQDTGSEWETDVSQLQDKVEICYIFYLFPLIHNNLLYFLSFPFNSLQFVIFFIFSL